jgi:hypothetical protein
MNRPFARVFVAAPAAIPFVFGTVRAAQAGGDLRYLATALASILAVALVFFFSDPAATSASAWRRSLLAVVAGTLIAAATAFAVGARSVAAVFIVSLGFTLCMAMSGTLGLFDRRR